MAEEDSAEVCAGFDENVVLAVKNCFHDCDMRLILIEKCAKRIVYHHRLCPQAQRSDENKLGRISGHCSTWFNQLCAPAPKQPETHSEVLEVIETFEIATTEPQLTEVAVEPTGAAPLILPPPPPDTTDPDKTLDPTQTLAAPSTRSKKVGLFPCEFCKKVFHIKSSLDKHMIRLHRQLYELQKKINRKGEHECPHCGLAFDKKPSMQRHISRKHAEQTEPEPTEDNSERDEAPICCDIPGCGNKEFAKRSLYKNHLRAVHNLPKKGRKPKEAVDTELAARLGLDETLTDYPFDTPQKCVYCTKQVDTRLKMYWHLKRSHFLKRKPCHLCGMMVKRLAEHVKKRHTQRNQARFVCEFCGDSFKGKSGYQFHIAGHTGEKKYQCRICGKQFRTSTESYNCQRGHQGIYKWRCNVCPFKSHQRNKYVRHLRIHTKSKPYMCPLCDHRTSRKDYLQKHLTKTHCTSTVDLQHLEKLYPNLYAIEEKVTIQAPISYSKLDLDPDHQQQLKADPQLQQQQLSNQPVEENQQLLNREAGDQQLVRLEQEQVGPPEFRTTDGDIAALQIQQGTLQDGEMDLRRFQHFPSAQFDPQHHQSQEVALNLQRQDVRQPETDRLAVVPAHRHELVQEGPLLESEDRPLELERRLVPARDHFVDQDGRLMDKERRFIDVEGRLVDQQGRLIEQDGRILYQQ